MRSEVMLVAASISGHTIKGMDRELLFDATIGKALRNLITKERVSLKFWLTLNKYPWKDLQ